ncbi:Dihydrodipicolinate reductase [Prochlorococcus marinus str. MIT 9515]|uniref:4-hydroxy-tetrahydrodipicolinate reductase n=1 Tax=Prochlorococcus marinus (strain MIT 9515) TaxID=167542 RepID=A2BWF3_PROM5|nr:4-hydroxy-tetrahydrodipicolinate reductase [Prochlorococcus marinus]ABM72114.1 Dihydrodipicolinate reductase [Prochlorococcus marinus str. MIT 9515]
MTEISKKTIPVLVSGALGKMGREVVNSVLNASDCELVAAIDINKKNNGENISQLLNLKSSEIFVSNDLEGTLCSISQNYRNQEINPVLVDFTHPDSVFENTRSAIAYGISPIIGTTGLSPSQINDLSIFAQKAEVGCAIIPNFSVGMVLLQQAASVAAKFYDNIELIEMHHNQKADSPSGTCIKTAEMIEEYPKQYNEGLVKETESLKGVRGGVRDSGLNIHSIRLPGLLAHQVVMMGSPGETYTIRHDTIDRKAYMPGVLQAIRKIGKFNSLIYGLEKLIF